jgi:uncharacterized protein YegP (UPF0339 family)
MTIPNPKFQIFRGANNEYYFRLRARNGEIILASEGYTSKQGCLDGIASVKHNAPFRERYNLLTAFSGDYYFVLKAANGQAIGMSEMYTTVIARENGIVSVMQNAPIAPVEDLT